MNDGMMALLRNKTEWLQWCAERAAYRIEKLPEPLRYPVVAAQIVTDWGMQESEIRYMYVDYINAQCAAIEAQQ